MYSSPLDSSFSYQSYANLSLPLHTPEPPLPYGSTCTSPTQFKDPADIYSLSAADVSDRSRISEPFRTIVSLQGHCGECIRILGTVDSGTMINAFDTATYKAVAHRLTPLSPSTHMLRMADGSLVPSTGPWSGDITWGNI